MVSAGVVSAGFFVTFTLHMYFFEFVLAVILQFPAFLALTLPFWETVAIFLLEEDHLTGFLLPIIFSDAWLPSSSTREVLFNLTFYAAFIVAAAHKTPSAVIQIFLKILFIKMSSFY